MIMRTTPIPAFAENSAAPSARSAHDMEYARRQQGVFSEKLLEQLLGNRTASVFLQYLGAPESSHNEGPWFSVSRLIGFGLMITFICILVIVARLAINLRRERQSRRANRSASTRFNLYFDFLPAGSLRQIKSAVNPGTWRSSISEKMKPLIAKFTESKPVAHWV